MLIFCLNCKFFRIVGLYFCKKLIVLIALEKRLILVSIFAKSNFHKELSSKSLQHCGGLAQLGERLNGIQKVRGSNPLSSTISMTYKNCDLLNVY